MVNEEGVVVSRLIIVFVIDISLFPSPTLLALFGDTVVLLCLRLLGLLNSVSLMTIFSEVVVVEDDNSLVIRDDVAEDVVVVVYSLSLSRRASPNNGSRFSIASIYVE